MNHVELSLLNPERTQRANPRNPKKLEKMTKAKTTKIMNISHLLLMVSKAQLTLIMKQLITQTMKKQKKIMMIIIPRLKLMIITKTM